MTLLRRYPGSDHVTGLRAYAALFVVMVHTAAFSDFGRAAKVFTESGKYGVTIFFVISGFSITAAFVSSATYSEYLVRRLVRIWPMYMAALGLTVALHSAGLIADPSWKREFAVTYDAYNMVMHATLLSFLDYRIANSILGVEWTIPIEVFWYLLIPILLRRGYGWVHLVAGIVILLVLGSLLRTALVWGLGKDGGLAAHWMPIRHGAYFLLGVMAFKLRAANPLADWRFRPWLAPAATLVVLAAMASGSKYTGQILALGTMVIVAFHDDTQPITRAIFVNPVVLFLGTVSYSVYLLHMPVLALVETATAGSAAMPGLAKFLVVAGITVLAATATYLAIERPTNRWGARVSRSFRVGGSAHAGPLERSTGSAP